MARIARRKLLVPPKTEGRRFIYMVGISGGRVKVGLTQHPKIRMAAHLKSFDVEWAHFFAPIPYFGAFAVERHVIENLSQIGERIRNPGLTEVFSGIDRDAVSLVRGMIDEFLAPLREHYLERTKEIQAWGGPWRTS